MQWSFDPLRPSAAGMLHGSVPSAARDLPAERSLRALDLSTTTAHAHRGASSSHLEHSPQDNMRSWNNTSRGTVPLATHPDHTHHAWNENQNEPLFPATSTTSVLGQQISHPSVRPFELSDSAVHRADAEVQGMLYEKPGMRRNQVHNTDHGVLQVNTEGNLRNPDHLPKPNLNGDFQSKQHNTSRVERPLDMDRPRESERTPVRQRGHRQRWLGAYMEEANKKHPALLAGLGPLALLAAERKYGTPRIPDKSRKEAES